MITFGYTSLGGGYSAVAQASEDFLPTGVSAMNGVYDQLYADNNPDVDTTAPLSSLSPWEYSTIFNAHFSGSMNAGNADFTASQIQYLRIKRAEIDSYDWMTIRQVEIHSEDDFSFNIVDYTARGNQEYKYAIVPVMNDTTEGAYNISTIKSDFNGLWVCEKDSGYNTIMDLEVSSTLNQVTSNVVTIGRRYPFVNKYGKANYYSGSFEATFVYMNGADCTIDIDGGVKYRELVEAFLTDGMPKIIKHMDGRIWLAMITDEIPKNEGDWYKLPTQTVSFTEIGRFDSPQDLYNAGFLDVVIDAEVSADELQP